MIGLAFIGLIVLGVIVCLGIVKATEYFSNKSEKKEDE